MDKLTKYCYALNRAAYRAVEPDRDPSEPSQKEHRATAAGTGGIYCALEIETCRAEVPHLEHPVLFEMRAQSEITVLDLVAYCEGEGIAKEQCYSGEQSLEKRIHSFYGQGIQALSWESQKRPGGTCLVLLPENIGNFKKTVVFNPL